MARGRRATLHVLEMHKTKFWSKPPETATSMANLHRRTGNKGRWDEAEELQLHVLEMHKTKFGANHPETLTSMANLASTYWNQGDGTRPKSYTCKY